MFGKLEKWEVFCIWLFLMGVGVTIIARVLDFDLPRGFDGIVFAGLTGFLAARILRSTLTGRTERQHTLVFSALLFAALALNNFLNDVSKPMGLWLAGGFIALSTGGILLGIVLIRRRALRRPHTT